MLRSGHKTPILPRAPKKRKLIKLQHEDGVGGSLSYESDEAYFDSDSEKFRDTFQLLSTVTTKLDELKVKINQNDDLIDDLKHLCSTITTLTTVNQELTHSFSN